MKTVPNSAASSNSACPRASRSPTQASFCVAQDGESIRFWLRSRDLLPVAVYLRPPANDRPPHPLLPVPLFEATAGRAWPAGAHPLSYSPFPAWFSCGRCRGHCCQKWAAVHLPTISQQFSRASHCHHVSNKKMPDALRAFLVTIMLALLPYVLQGNALACELYFHVLPMTRTMTLFRVMCVQAFQ